MKNEIFEGHGIRAKVYVSDGYLYLNRKKYQKTMQIRPKKGITYKIHKKRPKYLKVIEIRLRNGKNKLNWKKINRLRSKTKK